MARKKTKKKCEDVGPRRTICVRNVPLNTRESQIIEFFANYGPVESVRKQRLQNRAQSTDEFRNICDAFVAYKDETSARSALFANGMTPFDEIHTIRVDLTRATNYDKDKTVFLGDLTNGVKEDAVHELFSGCGDIKSVHLILGRHASAGKGYGFVEFCDEASVPLAVEKRGTVLGSGPIRVTRRLGSKLPKNRNKDKSEWWKNKRQTTASQGGTAETKPKRLGKKKLRKLIGKAALAELLREEKRQKELARGITTETRESTAANLTIQGNTAE